MAIFGHSMTLVEERPHPSLLETVRRLDRANKKIFEMELVLQEIARKRIADSVSAIHMRALAQAILVKVRRPL